MSCLIVETIAEKSVKHQQLRIHFSSSYTKQGFERLLLRCSEDSGMRFNERHCLFGESALANIRRSVCIRESSRATVPTRLCCVVRACK